MEEVKSITRDVNSMHIVLKNDEDIELQLPLTKRGLPTMTLDSGFLIYQTPDYTIGIHRIGRTRTYELRLTNRQTREGRTFAIAYELAKKFDKIIEQTPRIEAVKGTMSVLAGPSTIGPLREGEQRRTTMSDISKSKVEGEAAKERAGVPPNIVELTSSFLEPKPRKRGGRKTNRLPSKSSRQTRSRRLRSSRGRAKLL